METEDELSTCDKDNVATIVPAPGLSVKNVHFSLSDVAVAAPQGTDYVMGMV